MARKDLDEKLKEARETIVWASELPLEYRAESLEGAGYFLLGEVERLRKIEDGLEKIIGMRKQVAEGLREEALRDTINNLPNSAAFSRSAADQLYAEVWPLEALLSGE